MLKYESSLSGAARGRTCRLSGRGEIGKAVGSEIYLKYIFDNPAARRFAA
jgi:hypothetical protein